MMVWVVFLLLAFGIMLIHLTDIHSASLAIQQQLQIMTMELRLLENTLMKVIIKGLEE